MVFYLAFSILQRYTDGSKPGNLGFELEDFIREIVNEVEEKSINLVPDEP
jgi:hypothetical protein